MDIEQLYFIFDQDGNGFINRLELAVVMQNLGEALEQEEIQVRRSFVKPTVCFT